MTMRLQASQADRLFKCRASLSVSACVACELFGLDLKLVWQALEHRSLKLAEMLQTTYSVSLARETQLSGLLQRIKQVYLGAQSSGGMQEMMFSMLQMLTSGGS